MGAVSEVRVTDPVTGGGKGRKLARFDLIPQDALWALAEHYGKNCVEHGGKYEARNWERGYAWSLSFAAMMRHAAQFWAAKLGLPGFSEYDEESGSHHMSCVAWHSFGLFVYSTRGIGTDDRPSRQRGALIAEPTTDAPPAVAVNDVEPRESDHVFDPEGQPHSCCAHGACIAKPTHFEIVPNDDALLVEYIPCCDQHPANPALRCDGKALDGSVVASVQPAPKRRRRRAKVQP